MLEPSDGKTGSEFQFAGSAVQLREGPSLERRCEAGPVTILNSAYEELIRRIQELAVTGVWYQPHT